MEKLWRNTDDVIDTMERQVVIDLSSLLETPVQFKFFHANDNHIPYAPFQLTEDSKIPCKFKNIDNIDGVEDIKFVDFKENKDLLKVEYNDKLCYNAITSCFLRSNCRITHQPDWGDIYVYYRGDYQLDELSFIKYIVSFRNEFHFHEEVCEMIYAVLYNILQPKELLVGCLYTRRGGLDINPIRATHTFLLDSGLIDINTVVQKTTRQ
jgi:7-cyano-7-deazaguanine reductase